MKILTVSGSTRIDSTNIRLLNALPTLMPARNFQHYDSLAALPLFQAESDKYPWPEAVLLWRKAVADADALIISTPEYIHNMPALLKNALEWLTSSGELAQKRVLPITFTPHEPRGERAMQSLLWSLQALDARIVAQLPLFQNEVVFGENGQLQWNEAVEMVVAAVEELFN
ncbi:MAG: NADPH-dependent FMN reductase [Bacteroidota bacterium]